MSLNHYRIDAITKPELNKVRVFYVLSSIPFKSFNVLEYDLVYFYL